MLEDLDFRLRTLGFAFLSEPYVVVVIVWPLDADYGTGEVTACRHEHSPGPTVLAPGLHLLQFGKII